MIKATIDKTH